MKYLIVIEKAANNYGAYAPDIPGSAGVGKTLEDVKRSVAESITLHCEGNYPPPRIRTREEAVQHARDVLEVTLQDDDMIDSVEPAPMNPVSLTIERIIQEAGLSEAEVARRIGTSRAAMTRITDPFYWGHNLSTLHKIAAALGVELEVSFKRVA